MPTVKCGICKRGFYAKPSWIKYGNAKYCSRTCQHEGAKTGKWVTCFTCKKDVYKTLKAIRISKSKKYFCTKKCQTIWRNSVVYVGKNHSNWKSGEHVEYRNRLLKNGVQQYCRVCKTKDKRILCVHHVDRDRKNNSLSNLTWLCHNCHYLVHHFDTKIESK